MNTPVFSIWKSLRVLQKARIKIVARAIYTYLFFLMHTHSCSAAKWKVLAQAFANCVHGYDHERNVYASDVTRTRKSVHGIDSSVIIIWICQLVRLFFLPVLGWFYHVVLPVKAINCENCQLSTGAINLSTDNYFSPAHTDHYNLRK